MKFSLAVLLLVGAIQLAPLNVASANSPTALTGSYDCPGGGVMEVINGVLETSSGCVGDVVIPDEVISISSEAFYEGALTSVTIPNSVTSIGDYAFYNNSSLHTVNLGEGLISIGSSSFYQNALNSVTIPNSVTSIGDYAFTFNSNLQEVTLGTGVTSVGREAFFAGMISTLTLSNNIKVIGDYAFAENRIPTVSIPTGITRIAEGAFYMNELTSITLPANLRAIGPNAFAGNLLTTVTIPKGVTGIGESAFQNNQLTSVIFPDTVTGIGYAAFESNVLTAVKFLGDAPVSRHWEELFSNNYELTNVDVVHGTSGWGEYFSNLPTRVNYTLTYNSQGGTSLASRHFLLEEQISAPRSPTRTGYTFEGWMSRSNGPLVTFPLTVTAAKDLTLHAKWRLILVRANSSIKPSIRGKAVSSPSGTNVLTARGGTWSGAPAPRLTYQWFQCTTQVRAATQVIPRNCKMISRATGTTLRVTTGHRGKFLAVRVIGQSAGTQATQWLSKSTAIVK